MPPPATPVAVVAWTWPIAPGAAANSPGRGDIDDESSLVERHVEHTNLFQIQQGTE
jgi:hypothetical protein